MKPAGPVTAKVAGELRRDPVNILDLLGAVTDLEERQHEAYRAALRDIRAVLDDYSESRIDSLVAVGKIGMRLYAEPA